MTPDDEGGYFTWTDEDFRKVLDPDEYRVLSLHLIGQGRGPASRSAETDSLRLRQTGRSAPAGLDLDRGALNSLIERGKARLLAIARTTEEPFVGQDPLYVAQRHAHRIVPQGLPRIWTQGHARRSLSRV